MNFNNQQNTLIIIIIILFYYGIGAFFFITTGYIINKWFFFYLFNIFMTHVIWCRLSITYLTFKMLYFCIYLVIKYLTFYLYDLKWKLNIFKDL